MSVLRVRHFLPNIQSESKKKGGDAIERVLLDIKADIINLTVRD